MKLKYFGYGLAGLLIIMGLTFEYIKETILYKIYLVVAVLAALFVIALVIRFLINKSKKKKLK